MDKKVLYGIGVSLLVISALFVAGVAAEENAEVKTYIVGIDAEYPPYSYIDEAGNPTGFDVESIQWIAEQKGFEVKIQPTAWDGIIPALQAEKIDLIYSGMSITPARAEKVAFSIPYWTVGPAVAALPDSGITMEQFYAGEVTIGVQRGCSSDEYLAGHFGEEKYNQMVKDGQIKLFDSFPMSMVALKNKQVETVIFDDAGIDQYVKKGGYEKVGMTDGIEEFGVAVRKADTELLATINEGLTELMASEKWTELQDKYFNEEEAPEEPTSPGFGMLAVLAGLGAVAVLRRK